MRAIAVALLAGAAALAACGKSPPADVDPKWADHVGDIPFVVGRARGESRAAETGRPPMYYFTAVW